MSLSYGLYVVERDVVVIAVSGSLSGPSFIDLLETLLDNNVFLSSTKRVWDGREITEMVLDLREVEAVRKLMSERLARLGGRAAVVMNNEFNAKTAHLFTSYIDGNPVKVCTDLDEALTWMSDEG